MNHHLVIHLCLFTCRQRPRNDIQSKCTLDWESVGMCGSISGDDSLKQVIWQSTDSSPVVVRIRVV